MEHGGSLSHAQQPATRHYLSQIHILTPCLLLVLVLSIGTVCA